MCPEPMLHNKRSHDQEKPKHPHGKVAPHLAATREKPTHSNQDPVQTRIKNRTTLQMQNVLVNVDVFYKMANFYLVFRASRKSAIS